MGGKGSKPAATEEAVTLGVANRDGPLESGEETC